MNAKLGWRKSRVRLRIAIGRFSSDKITFPLFRRVIPNNYVSKENQERIENLNEIATMFSNTKKNVIEKS